MPLEVRIHSDTDEAISEDESLKKHVPMKLQVTE